MSPTFHTALELVLLGLVLLAWANGYLAGWRRGSEDQDW